MANLCAECKNASKGKMKYTELMRAASKGHHECVTSLIETGANVNAVDEGNPLESHSFRHFGRCDSALMEATKSQHNKCVEILIKSGADANLRGKDNDSPLIRAALNGDEKTVNLLIKSGASVDIVNMYDYSALISAARNGHDKCVKLLLEAGADVNISPDSTYSALTEASINGHAKCLALLIEKGTEHATISRNFGSRALIGAAEGGYHNCVKVLLSADANNNKTNDKDRFDTLNRSLVRAAFGGYTECVKLLLDAGADVNFHNRSFETSSQTSSSDNLTASGPLGAAAAIGANDVFTESLSLLQSSISKLEQWITDMSNGAQNSGQGENLVSNVSQSLEQFKLPEMDIDPAAIGGNTALIGAAGSGNVECAEVLIEAGADVNASNCKGKSPLMIAAAFHNLQCIQLFLRSEVHVNMVDSMGQNALQFHVVENGTKSNRSICTLLFAAGETINSRTIERTDEYNGQVTSVGVPRFLLRLQERSLSLKDICRHAVREHLLQLDAFNLFCKVPNLEPHIPSILVEYLLYDTSLEGSSEMVSTTSDDDNDDDDKNNNDDGDEDFGDDSNDSDDDGLDDEGPLFPDDSYDDAIFRTYPPLGIPYLPRNGLKLMPLPPPLPPPSIADMEVKVNEMANGLVNCVKEDENGNKNDAVDK